MKDSKNGKRNNPLLKRSLLSGKVFREDLQTRIDVASSSDTPGELLALLSQDPSDLVQLAVASNAHTPHHVVARLANHGSLTVKKGLANDATTPLEILNELAEDEHEEVRMAARQSRRLLVASIDADSERYPDTRKGKLYGPLTPKWA